MTASTWIYRTAAYVLSRAFLDAPMVRTAYIRRSVAAGEAVFPWSDLDLAIVVSDASGSAINRLRRRYQWARAAFPRLGECQVFTAEDLAEIAETDPYRSSLDRRFGVTALGPPPEIPVTAVSPVQAARRLVFWFDEYVPRAIQQGNRRNMRKFALEMANALGVLEGRWAEPLISRTETAARWGPIEGDSLTACFALAEKAHRLLRPPAPKLSRALELPGLTVAPAGAAAPRDGRKLMTPEVLDLMLQTQNPSIWREHGETLAAAGFEAPSQAAWLAAARRWAAGERLRGPGFLERGTGPAIARLRRSARILEREPPASVEGLSVGRYYEQAYEGLSQQACALRTLARKRAETAG